MRRLSQIMVFALAASALAAHAATINVPDDQPTIQQGLDAASEGDTVLVAAGTYTGAGNLELDFGGVNLMLLSEDGAANTTIDCEGAGRGFHFHSGEDTTAVVQGFTIQHAAADSGAGAKCTNYSSPRFLDCTFRLNEATTRGGGVCCYRSSAVFRECLFEENETAGTTYPYGGAMALILDSEATVADCRFSNNTAAGVGGGVYCLDADARFNGCVFSGNAAPGSCGGAAFGAWCALAFDDCAFSGGQAIEGGAIHVQNGALTVTRCDFTDNWAVRGGALFLWYSYASLQMSWCTLEGNTASEGGVLYCYGGASCTLSHCTLVSNSSTTGVIHGYEASPLVDHCIVAFSPQGAVASCQTGTETPVFTRLVVFGNASGDELCGSVSDTLHRDPRFCDVAGGDYHLCLNSICSDAVNAWGELIGALDVGCPDCESPVARSTWGAIKALYR